MEHNLLTSIDTLLKRVYAQNIRHENDEEKQLVLATIYEKEYTFELRNGIEVVSVARGDLRSFFLLSEVEMLDHICMPYIVLIDAPPGKYTFPEQRASDVAMRLHLIMEGDICRSEEMVIFVNAGTQRSVNYMKAK